MRFGFRSIRPRIRRLRRDPAARASATMMASFSSLTLIQGVLFFLLARVLGAHEFGKVAGVVAITAAILPFAGLGLGATSIMRIARAQAQPREALGNALAATLVSGIGGVGLAVLVGEYLLGYSELLALLLLFGFSEILLTKAVDVSTCVFLGLEQHLIAALFQNLLMLSRLLGAGLMTIGWVEASALSWAQLHLACGAFTAFVVLSVCRRRLGRPTLRLAMAIEDARKGFFFCVVQSSRGIHTDVDKMVLARWASESVAGAYTVGFRVIPMVCMPFFAFLYSQTARLFRRGHEGGMAGAVSVLRLQTTVACAFCMVLAPAIYFSAPLLPWLLGPSYTLSASILQSLCLLPFLLVVQSAGSEALLGANAQRRVGLLHGLAAAIAATLNLLLVPRLGWSGSVIAAYCAQSFLALGVVASIVLAVRSERTAAASAVRRSAGEACAPGSGSLSAVPAEAASPRST